jgi:hypothetical protein
MNFRIADTFTDSLAHLTGDEQKAVKTTAFDLQVNPANPGLSFHKRSASSRATWRSLGVDIRGRARTLHVNCQSSLTIFKPLCRP